MMDLTEMRQRLGISKTLILREYEIVENGLLKIIEQQAAQIEALQERLANSAELMPDEQIGEHED